MKKLVLAVTAVSMLCSFSAFGDAFDKHGNKKVYKVDRESILIDESLFRVSLHEDDLQSQGGCWWLIPYRGLIWVNPCPWI